MTQTTMKSPCSALPLRASGHAVASAELSSDPHGGDMTKTMNVISLQDRLAQTYGATSFMLCACQNDKEYQSGMLPVAIHDAKGALIVSLVCPECENEILIVNGRPE